MKLRELVDRCHTQAKQHGWWDGTPRTPLEIAALFHSEVSEFVEEVRDSKPAVYKNWNRAIDRDGIAINPKFVEGAIDPDKFLPELGFMAKPEGQAVELIDLVIRLGDYFGFRNWDILDGAEVELTVKDMEFQPDGMLRRDMEEDLLFKLPLEYAETLHLQIDAAVESILMDRDDKAVGELASLLSMVIWYFQFREWSFEEMFELKMAYNERRPYRHGNKKA